MPSAPPLAAAIEQALRESLAPTELVVVDESERHRGHAGWREGGQTHFRIHIVAAVFAGKGRIARHRLVNEAVAPAFARGLHALAIDAKAPGEA